MKAVVLVGGYGTRLRPLTFSIPKPLLPVGERPLLQLILERLRESKFEHVVLATGYHAELIHAFCGDGSRFGLRIAYVHEEEPLGTAGPLALVREAFGDDELVLINGDVLTTFDPRKLVRFRRDATYDMAVGYAEHVYESPFGVLDVDGDAVVGIAEKPKIEQHVSAGIYAIGPGIAEFVPARTFYTMPQLIQELLGRGRRVGALEIDDVWFGLENVAHFEEAIRHVEQLDAGSIRGPAPT
jgi:NDP-sugar pyrophosphorylase family protein